jgi:hypothetical protein
MARWPGATWQPVSQWSGTLRPIAVCLHHQAGSGNPAPVYASRNVSAHFWLPRQGTPVQHVDTGHRAWHGMAHNDYSIGVETEGCGAPPHAEPLTEHQLTSFGALMAWANKTHGIPLVLSEAVTQPGLNYHRCRGGPATGCPCDVRLNMRAEILRRAAGGASAPVDQPQKRKAHNMIASTTTGGGYWVVKPDGAVYAFGDGQFVGGANNVDGKSVVPAGREIVGIAGKGTDGYWLTADDGSVFAFGSAHFEGRADR